MAQRLRAAGCPVSLQGTDWHTAGDFEAALVQLTTVSSESTAIEEQPPSNPASSQLSEDARELLLDAARSKDDAISVVRVIAGLAISTRHRVFAEPGDRRSEARWKRALEELEQNGLIEALGNRREVFHLTHAGFAMADTLNESQKETQTESP